MTLGELLEYMGGYLDDRGSSLVSGDPDMLWSDALLVRYLNKAASILARRAWCIIEYGVAPAGVITLTTRKVLYPLHPSVLRVFDATPTTQTGMLGRTDDARLRDPYPRGADAFDIGVAVSLAGGTGLVAPGPPIAFASDAGTRNLRVYPAPAAAQNGVRVLLKIARLPILELTLDNMEGEPETPRDYDLDLCTYAAGRALTMPNVDSANKADGRALLKEFGEVCQEARRDRQRAEMSPGRWEFSSTTAVLR
ncbi:MAG: hypothetical protein DDT20_00683 [Firmicutes bacterium]|nr:hypothetical protein [Bacillota bacterium]